MERPGRLSHWSQVLQAPIEVALAMSLLPFRLGEPLELSLRSFLTADGAAKADVDEMACYR